MSKKKLIISIATIMLLFVSYKYFFSDTKNESDVFVEVQQGEFEINVFTTGELEAKNSVDIQGPSSARQLGIWQIKISD